MKKLTTLMLALAFTLGTVAVTYAQDQPKKGDDTTTTGKKGKKKSKKKDDTSTPKVHAQR